MNKSKKPRTPAAGDYSRHRGKTDDEIVHSECLRSLRNIESYNFKHGHHLPKRKGSPTRPFTSFEMEESSIAKMEYYRVQTEKWNDRNSIIAAPLGAELFLGCDRASPAKVMGAPRFYFEDPVPPVNEAFDWSRFPYSHEGHDAAKMITRMFHRNLNKKIAAATKMQSIYRRYRWRCIFLAYRAQVHAAGAVITRFCRRKYARLVLAKERLKTQNLKAERIQSHMRRALVRMSLPKVREERLQRSSRAITLWFQKCVHKIRKKRGTARRRRIHATRIQALWRGALLRMLIYRWHSSQIYIAYIWRRFFRRYYQPLINRIHRALRKHSLHAKIRRIQRVIRGFIGRRRAHRQRLDIIAKENRRSAAEQRIVEDALKDLTKSRNIGIMLDMTVDTESVATMMQEIDEICTKILIGVIVPAVPLADAVQRHQEALARIAESGKKPMFGSPHLHPVLRTQDRILLAVLVAFANRPNYCMDQVAWRVCKQYLTDARVGAKSGFSLGATLSAFVGTDNFGATAARDRSLSRSASAVAMSAESGAPDLEAGVGAGAIDRLIEEREGSENMFDIPAAKPLMFNIFDLFFSGKFAPKRLLQFRVSVRGRLPEILISQAAVVRLWTRSVQSCLVETVTEHRETFKPRYHCSDCLQAMWSPVALSRHMPCQRNSYFGWVHRQSFMAGEDLLVYTCNHLEQPIATMQPKKIKVKLDDNTEVQRLEDLDITIPGITVQKTVFIEEVPEHEKARKSRSGKSDKKKDKKEKSKKKKKHKKGDDSKGEDGSDGDDGESARSGGSSGKKEKKKKKKKEKEQEDDDSERDGEKKKKEKKEKKEKKKKEKENS